MLEQMGSLAAMGKAVKPSIALSRLALRKLRLFGSFDVRWVEFGGTKGLTAEEVEDLERFLTQRDTRALLSVLALTLLMPESELRIGSLQTVRDFFMNLAQRHWASHSSKWYDRRGAIWESLVQVYDRATPAGQALADAATEFEDFLRTPITRSQSAGVGSAGERRYIERLVDLSSDIGRVSEAIAVAELIKDSISGSPAPPIITYTSTSKPATFADLYVSRTLVESNTGVRREGRDLGNRGAPYRAVVHGAPGAGKSTFVRNLLQELAADTAGQPALLLTARSYFPAYQSQPIIEYLAEGLRNSLSLQVNEAQLRDALTLGLPVVIIDGLDEVTDINQRVELVQRIAAFSSEFPAVSVLVTSRAIGYERAPLPDKMFTTLVLDEYSNEQWREYIVKWFAYIERPDLVSDFVRESDSVADLRQNPLLLSLLCILYRERGSIPRRRRDIYAQCADLLFHTWDSHRHINQPEELHANGDRIMQELARWVFNSQKAQNGLPESVIKKTIGIYLRDAVGVEEGEARRRAGEFLEFCATRAWLLGTTGTDHGERLFGFTHRTFFEYFTAEAVSRSSSDPSKVAEALIQAHHRDATSVLPELLLQAVDDKIERGAAETFRQVCALTSDDQLILRLMEGVPLPSSTRARGFDRVLELWSGKQHIREVAFRALLNLNVDARTQFMTEYLPTNRENSARLFLAGWVTLESDGETAQYREIWENALNQAKDSNACGRGDWFESSIAVWRWRSGFGSIPEAPDSTFITEGSSGPYAGVLWMGLELAALQGGANLDPELTALFARVVNRARNRRERVADPIAHAFALIASARMKTFGAPNPRSLNGDPLYAHLYATAILYEASWYNESLQEEFHASLSAAGKRLWARRRAAERGSKPAPGGAQRWWIDLPNWLKDWADGRRSFTLSGE